MLSQIEVGVGVSHTYTGSVVSFPTPYCTGTASLSSNND